MDIEKVLLIVILGGVAVAFVGEWADDRASAEATKCAGNATQDDALGCSATKKLLYSNMEILLLVGVFVGLLAAAGIRKATQ